MVKNFNDRVTEDITFMVEVENEAWGYYHYYYVVTESGKLYKCKANKEQLSSKSRELINKEIKSLEALFLKQISIEELNVMLENSKKVSIDSKAYCTGVAFDAGDIRLYAFNNISEKPIMIGRRGDKSIHSENRYEEDIALWLEKLCM